MINKMIYKITGKTAWINTVLYATKVKMLILSMVLTVMSNGYAYAAVDDLIDSIKEYTIDGTTVFFAVFAAILFLAGLIHLVLGVTGLSNAAGSDNPQDSKHATSMILKALGFFIAAALCVGVMAYATGMLGQILELVTDSSSADSE